VFSFLYAYSGYNQIPIISSYMFKTAFIIKDVNYCYKVMSFGLKNAGATYQRLMDRVFIHLIGKSMEVYVDDMVVKSLNLVQHLSDLADEFATLRRFNLRLNQEKCVFGVDNDKFVISRSDITTLNNKNKEIITKCHLLKHYFPKTREIKHLLP